MPIKFQSPGDVAFNFFGLDIYYYGIVLAVAIFVGFLSAYSLYKKFYGKGCEFILDYSPHLVLIGIIGARLYYCLVNLPYYTKNPLEVFDIRQGGLSIHGMIILGTAALYCFSKYKKLSFWKLFDTYLCASLLAQSIGRWGNFFNSEAYGYPTNLPWKLFIPISKRPLELINFDYFHPTFLYESILDLAGFIILLILFKKLSKSPGLIASLYMIFYAFIRIFVEYYRIDSTLNISGIPIAQIMSVVLLLFGLSLFAITIWRNKKNEYIA